MKQVRKNKKLLISTLTLVMVLGAVYLAVGQSYFEPRLEMDVVGTWVGNEIVMDSESTIYENRPVALQFREDGTFLSTNQAIIPSGRYEAVGAGRVKIGDKVFQLVDYSGDVISISQGSMDGAIFLSRW